MVRGRVAGRRTGPEVADTHRHRRAAARGAALRGGYPSAGGGVLSAAGSAWPPAAGAGGALSTRRPWAPGGRRRFARRRLRQHGPHGATIVLHDLILRRERAGRHRGRPGPCPRRPPPGSGLSLMTGAARTWDDAAIAPRDHAPFRRRRDDRVLAGVAGGFAAAYGVDPFVVRTALVVLTFAGGIGVLRLPGRPPRGG